MAVEANPEQVEDFALQPICARPNGCERIHDGICAAHFHLQTDSIATWDGHQVIIQLESRLNGVTVHASSVRQQVELQVGVCAATLCRVPKQVSWHYDRRFAPGFNHFHNGRWGPRTQVFDNNISLLAGRLCHNFQSHERLFVPVQRALFPEIEITDQKNGNVNHHFDKAVPA